MAEVSTIGLDIAKHVFQAHGADASGHVVFRKKITRAKLIEFFASQPRCVVALEACGGAHHWGREIGKLGHTVRLIPGVSRDWGSANGSDMTGRAVDGRESMDGVGVAAGRNAS